MGPLLQQIMALFQASENLGSYFTFVWFLCHVGVESNDETGAAARNAVESMATSRRTT